MTNTPTPRYHDPVPSSLPRPAAPSADSGLVGRRIDPEVLRLAHRAATTRLRPPRVRVVEATMTRGPVNR